MPSPFPGMDPYLEDPAAWEEFHHVFVTECMYYLSDRLPGDYIAKINERVQLISLADAAAEQYLPDVSVARDRLAAPGGDPGAGGAALATVAAPVTIPSADAMEVREALVEVLRLPDHELVTSIELLSPANKFGEGVGAYRAKRRALVARGVHVLELDLLRRGARTELARPLPPGDYYALVFRGDRRPDVDVRAWRLRDPLPAVPVPLRRPDADVPLDLSAVVGTAYDRGRCARKLRYAAPPPGPLAPADAEWVESVLAARQG